MGKKALVLTLVQLGQDWIDLINWYCSDKEYMDKEGGSDISCLVSLLDISELLCLRDPENIVLDPLLPVSASGI